MKYRPLWVLTIVANVVLAQTPQQAEAGRAFFQSRCASCHATDLGGGAIHYDRELEKQFYQLGPYMMSAFSWSKY